MDKRITEYIIPGAAFFITGIVLYLLMPGQIVTDETSVFTARTFPTLVLGIILIFSAALVVQGLLMKKKSPEGEQAPAEQQAGGSGNTALFAGIFLLMAGAVVLGSFVGLLVSGLVIANGFLLLYRDRKPLHYAIVSVVVVVSYFLFKSVFGLDLP